MSEGPTGGKDSRSGEKLGRPEADLAPQAAGRGHDDRPDPADPAGPGTEPVSGPAAGARAYSERTGQTGQNDTYVLYRRGLDLLGRGSAAAAAQLLERAAAAEPESRSILEALARAQFDTRRYEAAAASFRRIVEASPSEDYAQFGLGLALARIGDHGAAAEHLALAAAMRPDLRHYTDALRSVRATLRARNLVAGEEYD